MFAGKVAFLWALLQVISSMPDASYQYHEIMIQPSGGPSDSTGQPSRGNDSEAIGEEIVEPTVELADFVINSGNEEVYNNKSWRSTMQLTIKEFAKRLQCVQQGFNEWVCDECLNPVYVMDTICAKLKDQFKSYIEIYEIERLSVFLLNHALVFRDVCMQWKLNETGLNCFPYEVCEDQLRKYLPLDDGIDGNPERLLETVENVLRKVKRFYEPDPSKNCFSAEKILSELHAVNVTLPKLAAKIIAHMLKGECIDVGEITDFMDDIFLHYGDRCKAIITPTAFEKLMSDLKTQGAEEHENHAVSLKACDKDGKINGELRSTTHNYYSSEQYDLDGISKNDSNKNLYTTRDFTKRITRSTTRLSSKTAEHERHRSMANKCLSAERLLQKFIMNTSVNITPNDFLQLCPALVQQVVSGVCINATDTYSNSYPTYTTPMKVRINEISTIESYLYGGAAVLIISLTSISGILTVPCIGHNHYQFTMKFFIALSFGTMTTDSALHLIPQALGKHGHVEVAEHKSFSWEDIPSYIGIQCMFLLFVYILYFFESTTDLLFGGAKNGHGHSHIPGNISVLNPVDNHTSTPTVETENSDSSAQESPHMIRHGSSLTVSIPMERMDNHNSTPEQESNDSDDSDMQENNHSNHEQSTEELPHTSGVVTVPSNDAPVEDKEAEPKPLIMSTRLIYNFTTFAIIIIVGDVMHNFVDGIAIGAAFAAGLTGGLSTSIAVFFHELPHELGDFALLMSTGLSYKQALAVNFVSALTSFAGLVIGVKYGANSSARDHMMSATAGVFLYVALAEMIPDLKAKANERPIFTYFIKHLGIILGFVIMIAMAIFEDHFHV